MAHSKSFSMSAETTPHQDSSPNQQGQLVLESAIPERPALAPHVHLVGEMQGSGYQEHQWLIQRDGQFIQVTELLYRLADYADGTRTLEEIAAAMTEATEWMVSADNVRHLILTKFMPLGLIALENGSSAASHGTGAEKAARSPLALNMRAKVIGPRIIGPIAAVLQVLYVPPILIVILGLIVLAHGWLYFVHGVAASIMDAFYTPGVVLIVLAILLASSVFHEFGHAAALRYGGGKLRGMGVGFYLIYPAFYTDVTDAYRLSRWARLRTDLGGVYFHLVIALGIIALYLFTGQEFLLFAVLLIDLEVLYQFVPFARLDGYWALTDLTGVPDFFSLMGPFVASLVPVAGSTKNKLPPLRPRVAATFALYLIITLPLLAIVFLFLLVKLPSLTLLAWLGLQRQGALLAYGRDAHDVVTMVASAVQILLLAIPVLGTVLLLWTAGRGPVQALWTWAQPTLRRRITGAIGAAGAIAILAFLWAPQLPFGAASDLQPGAAIDGISCAPRALPTHQSTVHLTLYTNGRPVGLPANIGIPVSRAIVNNRQSYCLYWLYTDQADHARGIVHMASPDQRTYTLGQFLDIWHYTALWDAQGGLGASVDSAFIQTVRQAKLSEMHVYVNGTLADARYQDVALTGHASISVEVGRPLRPPAG